MSATTGAQAEARLPQGTIRYRDSGSGEPIVFVHGLLVNGALWRKVTPLLEREFRCVVPDLPLGSHAVPMQADAELSPPGVARLLSDFLAALDLDGVTLVGNDTGGAICQLVAAHHPERLGRLVLTPCDAYENFLPPAFRPLQYAARVPGLLTALVQGARIGAIRRGPLGFGLLIKRRPLDDETLRSYLAPFLENGGVRRDALKVLRGISNRQTIEAAERLRDVRAPHVDRVGARGPLLQAPVCRAPRSRDPERPTGDDRGLAHLHARGPARAAGRGDRQIHQGDSGDVRLTTPVHCVRWAGDPAGLHR